jgi:DNA polymerase-3 subunit epsilon
MRMLQNIKRWFGGAAAIDDARWVVLDVETSGLDTKHDRLLALAAIAVHFEQHTPRIHLGDSFEVVLRQSSAAAVADKGNILLHGIGVSAQRAGVDPAQALAAFESWVGQSPLVAFHAAFDRAMIERTCRAVLGHCPRHAWLDLEPVAAVLCPEVRARALDEWLAHFRIECAVRHQAAADTLATTELMLKLWPALRRQLPRPNFRDVVALAAQRRWISH